MNERQFVEYTKEGYATNFTITVIEPYRRWEFDMENGNIKGHWIGIFYSKRRTNGNRFEHCGQCVDMPCSSYENNDPTKTKEENEADHCIQMKNLKEYRE